MMTRQRLILAFALLSCAALAGADPPDDPWSDAWVTDPVLRELADWVTFRLTFDQASMVPEMAAGEWTGQVSGEPAFAPGVTGMALRVGDGGARAIYPRGPNATMGTRGAVSLWICPITWTRVHGGNTTFLMTSNATFYLQRQGPAHDETGKLTRHEGVQYLIRGELTGNKTLMVGSADWPDGQWRLVVANWSWPVFSWSINGGEFVGVSVTASPDESYFGSLVVGATGGEPTLIDDLTIYRRPLTLAEAQHLYETFKPDAEDTP